jgi:hypothetical protein
MVSSASLTNYDTKNTLPFNHTALSGAVNNLNMLNSTSNTALNKTGSNIKRNSFNTLPTNSRKESSVVSAYSGHNFNTSILYNPSDFYFRNLLHFIRSGNLENYTEKVTLIYLIIIK